MRYSSANRLENFNSFTVVISWTKSFFSLLQLRRRIDNLEDVEKISGDIKKINFLMAKFV